MQLPQAWQECLPAYYAPLAQKLCSQVAQLRQEGFVIYPEQHRIFRALELTKPQNVRCVILGQDPYHGQGQAQGLAFSVPENTAPKAFPPSLKNIFKEISQDVHSHEQPCNPCLERWAKQGVLLLNTVLTVENGKAHSHARLGWQELTQGILECVAQGPSPVAVLLWGKPAQSYAPLFAPSAKVTAAHLVLQTAHPSPLSAHRGFLGCGHFRKVNDWLHKQRQNSIVW